MDNNSYSEGVLVKNEVTGEVLTIDMMVRVIRTEVKKLFMTYSNLHRYYELDDVVQDIVCYYFSPMKKVPKIRLVHYSELYDNNIQYLINLFKLTSRQWLNMLCRNRDVENNPISLNTIVGSTLTDDKVVELQDFIKDKSVISRTLDREFLEDVFTELYKYNFDLLFSKECKRLANSRSKISYSVALDNFLNDSDKMNEIMENTLRQRSFLLDFLNGYTKVELRSKYSDFNRLMKVIKLVLKRSVESN